MIDCIFTIDYEIYGNGQGSLKELIYEPAEKMKEIFLEYDIRFVNFVEVAELEMIESQRSDPAINQVKDQIRELHRTGFELGLHLHPQWYNATYKKNNWSLDYSEYNLCVLPPERIGQLIDRALKYFRRILDSADFTPLSFRAGNWLLQPTHAIASILAERQIKVDSSVFKGGLQSKNNLDYRPALKNGFYWNFEADVNIPDSQGRLLEIPTYTQMVWPWKMYTRKRMELEKKTPGIINNSGLPLMNSLKVRLKDLLRFCYPLKFDFCRMNLDELITMMEGIIKIDHLEPSTFKPIVVIGHTKELLDFEAVDAFLSYLKKKHIAVSLFKQIYPKCIS